MAKTLVNQVEQELQKLVEELNNFHSTVEYLDAAKSSVKDSIDSVKNVEEHFTNRISEIKKTYDSFLNLEDSISTFIDKIQKIDFPTRLDKIEMSVRNTISQLDNIKQETLDELNKTTKKIVNTDFEGYFEKIQQEVVKSEKFIDEIRNIDFPANFDKIEMIVRNTITQLDTIKRETLDEIGRVSQKIVNTDFDGQFEKIRWELDKSSKSQYQLTNTIEEQRIPEKLQSLGSELISIQKDAAVKLNSNMETVGKEIVRVITELEITSRMDNLSTRISEVSSRMQSLYDYTEKVEVSIKEKVNDVNNNQNKQIAAFQTNISRKMLEINKMMVKNFGQQRINTLITWLMMFAIIAMIIFLEFDILNPFR